MIQPKKNWPIENRAVAAAVKYQGELKNRKEERPRQMQAEMSLELVEDEKKCLGK